jgi:hypothetical protein
MLDLTDDRLLRDQPACERVDFALPFEVQVVGKLPMMEMGTGHSP